VGLKKQKTRIHGWYFPFTADIRGQAACNGNNEVARLC